ncbi:GntR family transcriptional regulator [Cryobacterium sp. TMT1-21]|uniref:GntR family transcriptional regulator n=1 Tax=Cryobacterium shii TaxID=1259235 RepID=A0AAQ2C4D6_9MICO|nr:GntR family transcriptional regulator [Cryobacterium shii]TFC80813.1 GntR family transcriptional regulator [Cryobacterium sp. TmT2-59]TFD13259.1 GntR family transcriptional regulator [Cryobacterium sp. TMT1-21]TFD18680.1 GntR family transcriptional regulator [Cryobacterium sp. TMT4-10]TFD28482.1 GntR family transcriptional regulator [Cryobacterium sp. TMT2-23]TFD35452.1 GntR family transcriptional regulator [Cryobacterium sp. TMT2-10]
MSVVYTETPTAGVAPPVRASERAYRQLRGEILDGLLAPGAGLLEVEQSARIGVSRTPLRAAIARLISDGLVAGRPGRGFMVTEMSVDSIRELYEVRRALEEHAARIAAERRDPAVFEALRAQFVQAPGLLERGPAGLSRYYELITEFDDALDAAVMNPFLVGALAGVRTHLARIRRLGRDNPGRLRAAAAEHLLIIEAILAGDSSLAAHATHVHLHQSLTNVLAAIQGHAADPAG